ncbi:MAG: Gfo/Idh/MocA family oxidoreductase [Clostridiales bacterium]|jgi:predicted dehydrogenase|nr:Gfo/Idh/MocA family oxidoreductase [Clostridiales bacterium]
MKKTVAAVIGCGTIANAAHIPSYLANPDVELRYLCDIVPERARAAAAQCGAAAVAVEDYRELLKDAELGAVSVCTPNSLHAPISIDCLRAGKDVLCEKPAARTYGEALRMQQAQHETGRTLNIGVVNRFNDSVNCIRRYIEGGRLGEVFHVYASFRAHRSIPGLGGAFTTKAVAGGGVLIDWGVHYLDLVMYCCGDPKPVTVSGEIFSKLGRDIPSYAYRDMWAGPPVPGGTYDVEDSVTGLIRTDGPVITLNGAWAQNIGEADTFIDFMGDRGGIRLRYGGDFTVYAAEHGALVEYVPAVRAGDMFKSEIDAFVGAVRGGGRLASHIDTVILTSQIMEAIYLSAELHSEIPASRVAGAGA